MQLGVYQTLNLDVSHTLNVGLIHSKSLVFVI